MFNSKLKVTPDSALATPEAIRFRIGQLRAGEHGVQALRRIEALKARLPADGEKPSAGVDASLLVSKSEMDWGIPTRSLCGSFR